MSFILWNMRDLQLTERSLAYGYLSMIPQPFCIQSPQSAMGSNKRSSRGKMVEDFTFKSNLSLLNAGSPTYLHPATASFSAIDLSITHPALYLYFR